MINNRGQVLFYGFMLGIVIFVLALALAPSVAEFTNRAMNTTDGDALGMNCSTTDDMFVKAGCLATDLSLFYFIGILVFISGAVVTTRYYFGGSS